MHSRKRLPMIAPNRCDIHPQNRVMRANQLSKLADFHLPVIYRDVRERLSYLEVFLAAFFAAFLAAFLAVLAETAFFETDFAALFFTAFFEGVEAFADDLFAVFLELPPKMLSQPTEYFSLVPTRVIVTKSPLKLN